MNQIESKSKLIELPVIWIESTVNQNEPTVNQNESTLNRNESTVKQNESTESVWIKINQWIKTNQQWTELSEPSESTLSQSTHTGV